MKQPVSDVEINSPNRDTSCTFLAEVRLGVPAVRRSRIPGRRSR